MNLQSVLWCAVAPLVVSLAGCVSTGQSESAQATPLYNPTTGRLEQLTADRNGDGKVDTRAYMDGVNFKSVEIDRNGDGRPDRWEYYAPAAAGSPRGSSAPQGLLVRAEEANGPTGQVTRREFYVQGVISRVEEDTDGNGRIDKWEQYQNGGLIQIELDSIGRGTPDRRLIYGANGTVDRVEVDRDGAGKFEPVPANKKNGG